MDVLDEKGNPLDPKILIQNTSRILDKVVRFEGKEQFEVEPSEKEVLKLRVETPGLKLRNSETGEPIPILFAVVEIIYAIDIKFTPFKLARYEDKRTGEHISDVAIAPLKWGNKSVSLMMVYKEDEGGSLILVNN